MTILTFPEIVPAKATWGLKANTEKFVSPLNSSTQTVSRPGARWNAVIQTKILTVPQSDTLNVFLAKLEGMAGRFYLWPHTRPGAQPFGLVASRAPRTLAVGGYVPNTTVYVAGDYIEAGGELKMVTSAEMSDAAGVVALEVTPPWRRLPAVGATVTGTRPKTVMMLDSDDFALTRLPGKLFDPVSISCTEVFL
jgi:hypothetical protein